LQVLLAKLPRPTTLLAHCGLHDFRGTFFLGFFWALWDEDAMTWHDRLSRTYLAVPQTFADAEISHASPIQ